MKSLKNILIPLGLFTLFLLIFNIFSIKIILIDTPQYIGVAKEFAGISLSKVRATSSFVYGFFLGQFLKIIPSLLIIKFFNMSFLILDAILIYLITKRKESLLLWIFSPIVWYMASYISPILPASFLFLLAYYTLKKYEEKNKLIYFIISAFSLGLACSIWAASIYLTIFFLVAFFYDKKLLQFILYLIPLFIGFSIRFLIDYYYFRFPFLSLITGVGSNILYFLGQQTNFKAVYLPQRTPFYILYLISIFIISPLLYKLYKLNIKENKKELIFLILSAILLIYPNYFQVRYLLVISPLIIILISRLINKKELIISIIISLFVIGIAVYPFFIDKEDKLMEQDLNNIAKEYPNKSFISGTSNYFVDSFVFSTLYWGKDIKEFITFDEYDMSKTNKSIFSEYELEAKPKINILKKMKLILLYERTDNRNYNDIDYLIAYKDDKYPSPPKEFKLVKEYNVLKLYKKNK
jgi:hypothetical protein